MTMRICLIGNSHLVALQDALAAQPGRWPGLACRFIGFRGNTVLETRVADGQLRPVTAAARAQMRRLSGTLSEDLRSHDALVVVGLGLKSLHAMTLWKEAVWTDLPSLAAVPDLAAMPRALLSRPAAERALAGQLARFPALRVARQLRAAVDRPLWLIGCPGLHAAARESTRARHYAMPEALAAGDGPAIAELHRAACDRAAAALEAVFLHQPDHTVQDWLFTRADFMAGRVTVQGADGKAKVQADITHANAAYGALMLDRLAEAVAA